MLLEILSSLMISVIHLNVYSSSTHIQDGMSWPFHVKVKYWYLKVEKLCLLQKVPTGRTIIRNGKSQQRLISYRLWKNTQDVIVKIFRNRIKNLHSLSLAEGLMRISQDYKLLDNGARRTQHSSLSHHAWRERTSLYFSKERQVASNKT